MVCASMSGSVKPASLRHAEKAALYFLPAGTATLERDHHAVAAELQDIADHLPFIQIRQAVPRFGFPQLSASCDERPDPRASGRSRRMGSGPAVLFNTGSHSWFDA